MMTRHESFLTLSTLDDLLLDVATEIDLSPADRRIMENRFRKLKTHLERPSSPLAHFLKDGLSLIYAQGSIATSTTIISGTEDDRFDVDAIVEMNVPAHWSEHHALDMLEAALQGFPGVIKIVRCTRCIQLQFAFMHMDVTMMDRSKRLAIARAGEILHAPDEGASARVPANPWGFTAWFRSTVGVGQAAFAEALRNRRSLHSKSRLRPLDNLELALAKADQVDLPPMIPSAIDAQEAVALKLLKRHLYIRYERLTPKRPPSIYFTKRAGSIGYMPEGLTAQLLVLADSTARILREHLAAGTLPNELNPSYPADRLNDRWPLDGHDGIQDMEILAGVLEALVGKIARLARAPLSEIVAGIRELFGERVGAEVAALVTKRFDTRGSAAANLIHTGTGNIRSPAIAKATRDVRPVPNHNFHPMRIDEDDDAG
jgi:hypothetical protein